MNFQLFRLLIFFLCFFAQLACAQNIITGTFPQLASQQIKLIGFDGFGIYKIDSTTVSAPGVFTLKYTDKDKGMGYLAAADNKSYFVVLANENIELKGEVLSMPETIKIVEGKENQLFGQYAYEHPRREQALSAWDYLEKIYANDPFYAAQETPKQAISSEKQRIKTEDRLFLSTLNPDTYVSFYLPLRKLVSSVSIVAQYRSEEIPAAIASFRSIDYTDHRLYKSGLLADVIESHFWLLENSGRSLDSVYIEMNTSIDILVENLLSDNQKLNEITEYLFKFLEKRSLFGASEYLAFKLLNEQSCTINNSFAAQLESYRAMKKGTIAPDFDFQGKVLAPAYSVSTMPQRLSGLTSKYTVLVFGASWCPQCPQELSQIKGFYQKWKAQGVEVIFVSLDENEKMFNSFAGVFPFISLCDYKKWESPMVQKYHVFATPTLYLLDHKREILLRPHSVKQLDSWVDWYLVQGKR